MLVEKVMDSFDANIEKVNNTLDSNNDQLSFLENKLKKTDRSCDVSVRFQKQKTRKEVRMFLKNHLQFPIDNLIGICSKPLRWVDFTCKNVNLAIVLRHKLKTNRGGCIENVISYYGNDEVKVSMMWVTSSVREQEIIELMSKYGKIKKMVRLRDKEDGLENGSVLLVYERNNFKEIPKQIKYGQFKFLVRHDGQTELGVLRSNGKIL